MAEKEIIKEYSNGELTVVWKPSKCIHSRVCIDTLPNVYDPEAKPWIKAENATTDELKAQIAKCPSGALSYYMNDGTIEEETVSETKVEALVNGPLLVHGTLEVHLADGKKEVKTKSTAFCRCGFSDNKPYCDGSHRREGFKG